MQDENNKKMTNLNKNNSNCEFYKDCRCCCCQNIHEEIKSTQKSIAHLRTDISKIIFHALMRKENF